MDILYWPFSLAVSLLNMHLLMFALLKYEKRITKSFLAINLGAVTIAVLLGALIQAGHITTRTAIGILPILCLAGTVWGLKKVWHVVASITIFILLSLLESVVAGIMYSSLGLQADNFVNYHYYNIMLEIISIGLVVAIVTIYRVFTRKQSTQWTNSKYSNSLYLLLISLFSLILYFMPLQQYYMQADVEKLSSDLLAISISAVVFIFTNISCYVNIIRKEKSAAQATLYRNIMEGQEKYYSTLIEKDSTIRSLHHDMQSHLLCISSFIEGGEIETAVDYTASLLDRIRQKTTLAYQTGNNIVNMLVNQLATSMPGISILVHGKIPDKLYIDQIDLCILFSNLLGNAADAAAQVKEGFVDISFRIAHSGLSCTIANSINGPVKLVDGLPVRPIGTTGFGVQNVREVVQKHGGLLDFEQTSDTFSAVLFLPDVIPS